MIVGRREGRSVRHARQRAHGFLKAFDAAQAAAGRTGEMTPPFAERGGARLDQPHAQFDTAIVFDDLDLTDVGQGRNKTFGEAEAECKILEILRRRHHHRVGAAVVAEGDRGLFGDDALAGGDALTAPDQAVDGGRRLPHAATPRPRRSQ